MERMGYTATTAPNGGEQKQWHDTFNAGLEGRSIYVLTDNDEVGKHYGHFIAKHVVGIAKSVYVIPSESILPGLRNKGDISDVVAQIGIDDAANRLRETIAEAKPYDPATEKADQENKSKVRTQKGTITSDTVKNILSELGIKVQLNLISNRLEIKGLPEKYSKSL